MLLPTLPAHAVPLPEVQAELRNDVVRLRRTYRFGDSIGQLAAAIRSGRPDDALAVLNAGTPGWSSSRWTDDATGSALNGLRTDVVARRRSAASGRPGAATTARRCSSSSGTGCSARTGAAPTA